MGAVINEGSMKTIMEYIERPAKKDGRLLTGGRPARRTQRAKGLFLLQPTLVLRRQFPALKSESWRRRKENLSGPVLWW